MGSIENSRRVISSHLSIWETKPLSMKTGGHRLVPMSLTPVDSRNSMGLDRVMVRNIMIGTNKRASQRDEHKVSDLQIPLSSPHGRRADGSHIYNSGLNERKHSFLKPIHLSFLRAFSFITCKTRQPKSRAQVVCSYLLELQEHIWYHTIIFQRFVNCHKAQAAGSIEILLKLQANK